MAELIYPDQGLTKWLQLLTSVDLEFHLFKNNVTPDRATVLADLTEQDGAGYDSITVATADWLTPGVAASRGTILANPVAFVCTGTAYDSYGYYVTTVGGTVLLLAVRFDGAPITCSTSEPLHVTPLIADRSKAPAV